jgi:uncharacterized protein
MVKNILRNRVLILSILGAATVALGIFSVRTKIDGSITKVLADDDPVFTYNQLIEDQFGSSEEIVLLISSDLSVYDKKMLPAVDEITKRLSSVAGVRGDEALSITVLAKTLPELSSVAISPEMTGEEAEKIETAVTANPLFSGKLAGSDGRSTIVTLPVSVSISYNNELLNELVTEIDNRVTELQGLYPFLSIGLSGHPIVQSAIMEYMSSDLLKLFPIALGVVMLILLIALRSFRAMLIPIMVTLISVTWTFGLKGILGSPITLTETVIPVILISLGCADGIHILSEFLHYYNRKQHPVLAVKQAMDKLKTPIILTSVTTALGFSSLAFASGQSLKNMGLFLGFGVIVAMGFSLLYIPIILASFSFKKKEKPELFQKHFSRMRVLQHTALGIMRYWPIPAAIVLGMLGISVFGLVRTEADTDEVRYFKESTPVRQVTERIEDSFGGIGTLYIVFESEEADRFKQPDAVYALDTVQQFIETQPNVGYVTSVADYIKMLFYTIKRNDPEAFVIPESDLFVKRLAGMLTSEDLGDNKMLYNYISRDFSTACMHVRLRDSNTKKMKVLLAEIGPLLEDAVPGDITVRYAGDYIRLKNGENIVRSQIISLFMTIGTILVILSIFFRTPILGMLITFPVTIAILFNFAIMWLFNVSLNPATAIIASVGLGVGVDYGIHFFSRFRRLYLQSGKYIHSIVDAVVETTKGIFSNALAVGIGFLVLLFSSYGIINDIGWIVAVSMITTALLTVTVIPILLFLFKPKIPAKISFISRKNRRR